MKKLKLKAKKETKQKINPMKMLKEKRSLDEELEEKGVVFFRPQEMNNGNLDIDNDYLRLPKDLTECTSQELGRYLNAFTQHRMYLRTLIGWQQLSLENSKREYYNVSNPIYNTLTKKDFPSETSKERYINNHPEVQEEYYKYRDEVRKLDLLYLNLNSIDDGIFLISREITRRCGDTDIENRNINVQKR